MKRLIHMLRRWLPGGRIWLLRNTWQANWEDEGYHAKWLGRGVSPEMEEAVASQWFKPGSAVLDLGCGQGELTDWFARAGFSALGVDIAPAAIERARSRYPEVPGQCEFQVADLCCERPRHPEGGYAVLIDRGCLHQIPRRHLHAYASNVVAVSAPEARMMIFCRAFRTPNATDAGEYRRVRSLISYAFGDYFEIERLERTCLDPNFGADPETALGGIVAWLRRAPIQSQHEPHGF